MEPRSVFGALRLLLEVNVLLGAGVCVAKAIAAWSGSSRRHRLRYVQTAFIVACALPVMVRAFPHQALVPAAAQVWSGGDIGTAPSTAVTIVGSTPQKGRTVSVDDRVLVLLLVGLVAAAAGRITWLVARLFRLRRHLDALPTIRRLGRVSVVASQGMPVPFSAWLFGRAYVVIPEALVAASSTHYVIAIRHEIAHHRHGDTIWIQVFELLSALAFWNPAMRVWSRLFANLMELACDEALLIGRRVDPRTYARCLVETAERVLNAGKLAHVLATTEMASVSNALLRKRIEIMLAPRIAPRPSVVVPLVALLVLTCSAYALGSALQDRSIGVEEARALAARANTADFSIVVNEQVLGRLNRLIGTPDGRAFVQDALQRMPQYRAAIEQRLAERGLPVSLVAVALVESGFRNSAGLPTEPTLAPGMRGAGVWMFIPSTARRYGLIVEPLSRIDERLDVAKETDAAIAYLADLHQTFGDWHLALAAYNQGPREVTRVMGEAGSRDALALAEQGNLNDYVATVLAGVLILANPELVW